MLCGVCLKEEDVVEPAVLDGRRQSLPGNGTGFGGMSRAVLVTVGGAEYMPTLRM